MKTKASSLTWLTALAAGGAIAGGYIATFLSFQGLFGIMTIFCLLSSVIIIAMPKSFFR